MMKRTIYYALILTFMLALGYGFIGDAQAAQVGSGSSVETVWTYPIGGVGNYFPLRIEPKYVLVKEKTAVEGITETHTTWQYPVGGVGNYFPLRYETVTKAKE
ncbi:MAG: hypothetical protein HZB61_00705 [Nitrospirae bacterium]|nr:hypothetical protein [Nitrospirota bacterium]